MTYEVIRAAAVARDLEAIFDFLFETARDFGDPDSAALDRASARLMAIEDAIDALSRAPHQGTLRPELGTGIRNVTKDRAILYFDVDDNAQLVRVLAVFFGGQDHQRRMLIRMLEDEG